MYACVDSIFVITFTARRGRQKFHTPVLNLVIKLASKVFKCSRCTLFFKETFHVKNDLQIKRVLATNQANIHYNSLKFGNNQQQQQLVLF